MIEFIVVVDPPPNTKARHFVSVAQALDPGFVRPGCHARKRDRFSAHRKPQKVLDRLGLLRHVAPPFTHFFPRRAWNVCSTPGPTSKPAALAESLRSVVAVRDRTIAADVRRRRSPADRSRCNGAVPSRPTRKEIAKAGSFARKLYAQREP